MTPPEARGATDSTEPAEAADGPDSAQFLYTPAQAAEVLAVPESWLRRKAGRRLIPCTMLGKHLRFTQADLTHIAEHGEQTVRPLRRGMRLT